MTTRKKTLKRYHPAFTICLVFMILSPFSSYALKLRALDTPMTIGPQYPLYFAVATFQPDTAYVMPLGEIAFQISQSKTNSFEFSNNSAKNEDKDADPSEFIDDDSEGYSVYIDVELRTTLYQARMAVKPWLEIQFRKQTAGMDSSVALDKFIEEFHETVGLDNYERERAERGQFDFYVYDNETDQLVIAVSNPEPFEQIVDTYSVKLSLFQTDSMALALKSSTAYYYLKTDSDDTESERESHDANHSLLFSAAFDLLTIHAAYSFTHMERKFLENSTQDLYFQFLGFNFHVAESWDVIFQLLNYRSIYPHHDEGDTSLSDDILEFAIGLRGYWDDFASIDLAFVENYTNAGPSNIDVAFYGSLEVTF